MQTPTITIHGKPFALRWNLRSHYRLQGLAQPSKVDHLTDPDRSVKAMVDFAWAALPDAAKVETPEDLAEALSETDNGIEECSKALTAMFAAASESPEKKTEPS